MDGDWDPEHYARFKEQRAQPFWDLAALIETDRSIERLVDLGCGPGDLTSTLAERLGAARTVGVDSSPAMLVEAAAFASDSVGFERGDIGDWQNPASADVVFSNAALHWVSDHGAVLERWIGSLRAGGQLAVQVPSNADNPAYVIAAEVAHREPFASAMGGDVPPDAVAVNVHPPEWYAQALYDLGCDRQHVHLRVYDHVLPSTAAVAEWLQGTSLTRFYRLLPDELHGPLTDAFRDALIDQLGDLRPYFFPFKRVLMWARLPG